MVSRRHDFCEHLDTYRDRKVVVIIADRGDPDELREEYICGICGFVMNKAAEYPRCKMQVDLDAQELDPWERDRRKQQCWDEAGGYFTYDLDFTELH